MMKGEMRNKRKISQIFLLFLALLQISTPSSAQNTGTTISTTTITTTTTTKAPNAEALGYRTQPVDVSVAVGEPAVFRCSVPKAHPNLTFTFYGSHHNYSLTCPNGHVEDIPQALYGSCEMKNEESLAIWTLQGTSYSDNGTRVVCQQLRNPNTPSAVLHVYDDGASHATLIGCVIGGFFGVLLVAGLLYVFFVKSDSFQECCGGEMEEDMTEIVSKE